MFNKTSAIVGEFIMDRLIPLTPPPLSFYNTFDTLCIPNYTWDWTIAPKCTPPMNIIISNVLSLSLPLSMIRIHPTNPESMQIRIQKTMPRSLFRLKRDLFGFFKGTQEWEIFWVRFWILYYFIVSYVKILRFCKKTFWYGQYWRRYDFSV
jgi:hypothetical protein